MQKSSDPTEVRTPDLQSASPTNSPLSYNGVDPLSSQSLSYSIVTEIKNEELKREKSLKKLKNVVEQKRENGQAKILQEKRHAHLQ